MPTDSDGRRRYNRKQSSNYYYDIITIRSFFFVITIVKRGCWSDQQWVSLGAQYTTTIQCLVLYRTVCGTTFQAHNNIYTVSYSVISGSTLVTALCTYSPVQIYSWWGGGKRVEKKSKQQTQSTYKLTRKESDFISIFLYLFFFPSPTRTRYDVSYISYRRCMYGENGERFKDKVDRCDQFAIFGLPDAKTESRYR